MAKRREPIERPPSQAAGVVFVVIGAFALVFAVFVLFFQQNMGIISNFRTGLGVVIALYGLFRIVTGILMIRRAKAMNSSVTLHGLHGKNSAQAETSISEGEHSENTKPAE